MLGDRCCLNALLGVSSREPQRPSPWYKHGSWIWFRFGCDFKQIDLKHYCWNYSPWFHRQIGVFNKDLINSILGAVDILGKESSFFGPTIDCSIDNKAKLPLRIPLSFLKQVPDYSLACFLGSHSSMLVKRTLISSLA